mgnify:CR=1 FL=1
MSKRTPVDRSETGHPTRKIGLDEERFDLPSRNTKPGDLPGESRRDSVSDEEPKGLCSTCRMRDVCVYPKPAGGVWHCEEFQ